MRPTQITLTPKLFPIKGEKKALFLLLLSFSPGAKLRVGGRGKKSDRTPQKTCEYQCDRSQYHIRFYRHRAGGGFIKILRLASKVTGETRPYNTVNHISAIAPNSITFR